MKTNINFDFSNFLFRSHYMGELMTPPQGKHKSNIDKYNDALSSYSKKLQEWDSTKNKETKTANLLWESIEKLAIKVEDLEKVKDSPLLSSTCKRRLARIYTEVTTGRTRDIKLKYFEKGLKVEEDVITLYSQYVSKFFKKNKDRLYNEFIEGEYDFEDKEDGMVIDAKASWDIFSFDATRFKPVPQRNFWQIQCYMWLKNMKRGRVVYGLIDTPENIVAIEKKKLLYDFVGTKEDYEEACKEIDFNHTYKDLPLERKIHIFNIERDDEKIEDMKKMIPIFRNYLNNFEKMNSIDEEDYYNEK